MTDKPEVKILPSRFQVVTATGPKEVFMSAGLVRLLAAIVEHENNLLAMYADPTLQTVLMSTALQDRTARGEHSAMDASPVELEIDVEEGEKLIEWISGHVLNFFTRNSEIVARSLQEGQPLQKLTASLTGLKDSQQEKLSAGDTTPV